MKFIHRLDNSDLGAIERLLADTLVPVRARPEFVSGLRQKLVDIKPETPVLPRGWQTFFVSTAGVFGGLLIVGTAVRMIAGLILMLNISRQIKSPKSKQTASASPA